MFGTIIRPVIDQSNQQLRKRSRNKQKDFRKKDKKYKKKENDSDCSDNGIPEQPGQHVSTKEVSQGRGMC